jgi:hypothetical protein
MTQNLKSDDFISFVDTKMLYLSTKSASGLILNGDLKSWARYDLRNYINFQDDPSVEAVSISIPYVTICNSNYIINSTNNVLNTRNNDTAVTTTYTFPSGNFTADSFITTFNSLAVAQGYTMTLNRTTNRFTITRASGSVSFSLLGTSTCDYIMGFSGTVTSTVNTLTCPRVCNFLNNATYNIACVNGGFQNGIILNTDGTTGQGNIMVSVPNSATLNSQIVYSNPNGGEFKLASLNQNTLEIQILDNNNKLVDFNGIASFFSLQVKVYRRVLRNTKTFRDILNEALQSRFQFDEELSVNV